MCLVLGALGKGRCGTKRLSVMPGTAVEAGEARRRPGGMLGVGWAFKRPKKPVFFDYTIVVGQEVGIGGWWVRGGEWRGMGLRHYVRRDAMHGEMEAMSSLRNIGFVVIMLMLLVLKLFAFGVGADVHVDRVVADVDGDVPGGVGQVGFHPHVDSRQFGWC